MLPPHTRHRRRHQSAIWQAGAGPIERKVAGPRDGHRRIWSVPSARPQRRHASSTWKTTTDREALALAGAEPGASLGWISACMDAASMETGAGPSAKSALTVGDSRRGARRRAAGRRLTGGRPDDLDRAGPAEPGGARQ